MKEATKLSQLIRFEAFEVNLRTGELCKSGDRIRLPEQSFQILAMRLERRGQLVTREEIRKKLWPNDTIVEFENSINAGVKKLRIALGDSADWERAAEGLKKAKPIPQPSHPVRPKEVTPSGGLQRFDPKTGHVTEEPASTKAAAPAKKHKQGKGCTQPKNATGSKRQ